MESRYMNQEKSRLFLQTAVFVFILLVCFFLFSRNRANRAVPFGSEPEKQETALRKTPVVRAIEKAMPSVVNLSTSKIVDRHYSPWQQKINSRFAMPSERRQDQGYSIGSGSIIDKAGLIVTSAHVVSRAAQIEVTLNNGMTFKARTLAEDIENDVALLQILAPKRDFKTIQGIHPGDMMLGETTIAVGNPYGLDGTITVGVLSGIGRSLINDDKVIFSDLLQTDAAVFPGNSGGPLINLNGKMLGMNMAVRRDAPGIGFAIPFLRIENILANWMLPERMNSARLGIVPGIKPDGTIFLRKVFPASPAEAANLKEGQQILRFNGWNPHGNLLELSSRLWQVRAGETVTLKVEGISNPVRLRAVALPALDGALLAKFKLQLGIENLTPTAAKALNYPYDSGVVVTSLPATLSGLGISRGDLLVKLGQRMIHSLDDVAQVLQDSDYLTQIPAYFLSVVQSGNGRTVLREHRIMFNLR